MLKIFLLLLSLTLCNVQAKNLQKEGIKAMQENTKELITLFKNKRVSYAKDMDLMLQRFSHKHSVDAYTSQGTAHIKVFIKELSFDILLSTQKDERENKSTFDKLYSHGYEFYLKSFNDEGSIDIEIQKSEDPRFLNLTSDTYFN